MSAGVAATPADNSSLMKCPVCADERAARGQRPSQKWLRGHRGLRRHLRSVHRLGDSPDDEPAVQEALERAAEGVVKQAAAGGSTSGRGQMWRASEGMAACRDGDVDAVRRLVDAGRFSVDHRDSNGSTGLHWAASAGHVPVVRYLIATCAADPYVVTKKDGRSALHWAARYGRLDAVKFLVDEAGMDVDHGTTRDATAALQLACYAGSVPVAMFLASRSKLAVADVLNDHRCSPAHFAALGGSVEVAEWLLDQGVSFDVRQREGVTALMKAAVKGKTELVRLLASRVKVTALTMRDTSGYTSYALAKSAGFEDTAAVLADAMRTHGVEVHRAPPSQEGAGERAAAVSAGAGASGAGASGVGVGVGVGAGAASAGADPAAADPAVADPVIADDGHKVPTNGVLAADHVPAAVPSAVVPADAKRRRRGGSPPTV